MDSELTNIAAIKALNQGVATTDEVAFDNTSLNAIAKDISDTAVDVFVYDTSKDSDGGAWRKRTQGTSWYNETLNTATRGSRKEFPSVAVIVAESSQVTIYDGDDPDMPMWMVFETSGTAYRSKMLPRSVVLLKSSAMLNGMLVVGGNKGTSYHDALLEVSFLKDEAFSRGSGNTDQFTTGISGRNNTSVVSSTHARIVSATINDIAMTVLPNAPIDSATGLPIPTIAVATDGGVSVIKDDGSVVDITGSQGSAFSVTTRISIDNDNVYFVGPNTNRCNIVKAIPSSDTTFNSQPEIATDKFALNEGDNSTLNGVFANGILNVTKVEGLGNNAVATNGDSLNLFSAATGNQTGMAAYVASTYNTGWMNGDIKLATLSDTDDTDVTGSELVTNGTFDTNTTGWTAGVYAGGSAASISIVSGKLRITSSGATYGSANQTITTVVGKTYVVTVDFTKGTAGGGYLWIGTSLHSYSNAHSGLMTSTQTKIMTFVATGTTTYLNLILTNTTNGTGDFDNVSVRLAEEDRSVNGNGLQVFGTVTKTAVATGADLVGYSGFSTSNYLQQPYNADLDFGTGDFSVMGWMKATSANASQRQYIISRSAGATQLHVVREYTGAFQLSVGGVYTNTANTYNTAGDYHFAMVRRSGVSYIYVNGVLDLSLAMPASVTSTAPLYVGIDSGLNASNWGMKDSLSLLRISATAPSPEQIAKIYEDEKVLFQENAKATLYGTSDAVTALAHDDSTDLLHVGTSAGRSVFQGLRRVENTTDAVGATISASNGLVAED